jgi:diacylglycerol kinase (ATP)
MKVLARQTIEKTEHARIQGNTAIGEDGMLKRHTKTSLWERVCKSFLRIWYNVAMEQKKMTRGQFTFVSRAKSFAHAWRGIFVVLKTTPNFWIHIVCLIVALVLGYYFSITKTEWLALALAAGFVLTAEAFNTALEIDINLTSPEYHPYARDVKDVAAGAVLLAAITAAVVGVVIFGSRLV